jgi:hypothetical protein
VSAIDCPKGVGVGCGAAKAWRTIESAKATGSVENIENKWKIRTKRKECKNRPAIEVLEIRRKTSCGWATSQ